MSYRACQHIKWCIKLVCASCWSGSLRKMQAGTSHRYFEEGGACIAESFVHQESKKIWPKKKKIPNKNGEKKPILLLRDSFKTSLQLLLPQKKVDNVDSHHVSYVKYTSRNLSKRPRLDPTNLLVNLATGRSNANGRCWNMGSPNVDPIHPSLIKH